MDESKCIAAWRNLLGDERVVDDPSVIAATATATFPVPRRLRCVIQPVSTAEVQGCLRIANEFQGTVYPVSQGKNWGLGSKAPTDNVTAVMDLSRMNRIVDFHEKLAYITVEPGVTFQQVHAFLRERQSELFVAVTGGPPDGSLIGNTVDRGEGVGPYGDRLTHACDFEVVLPTGECVHTGFGRFPQARARAVHSYGVGPYLDGLFTQSNLGIVTRMTMWLMPRPRSSEVFFFRLNGAERLPRLVDRIAPALLHGVLGGNSFILWNSYKVLARKGRYPWKAMEGKTPLRLSERTGREPWYGNGVIYAASPALARATREHLVDVLGDSVDEIAFVEAGQQNGPADNSSFVGVPDDTNIRSLYWRKKFDVPEQVDPHRDRCGVHWLCPVVPADGEVVLDAVRTIESTVLSAGFEPNVSVNFRDGRCLQIFVAIVYDRDVEGEDERARACHDDLFSRLVNAGHLPCRLGIQSMSALPLADDDFGVLISRLKRSFDPHDVLAPGRYDFRSEWRRI